MTILEHEVRSLSGGSDTGLSRRLFSREEYRRIGEIGIFDGQRVELIEGEITEMEPIGDAHAALTQHLGEVVGAAFGAGYTVRNQAPITLGGSEKPSEAVPDIAVAVGTWRDYLSRKPSADDIVLVVEVADNSLKSDRATKCALYASAGIPEYWIVNLVDFQLEVYREPGGNSYDIASIFVPGDQVVPLNAVSMVAVRVFIP